MRVVLLTVVLLLTVTCSSLPLGTTVCLPPCDAGVPCILGHCFGTGGGEQSATCCNNGGGPPGKR